MKIKHTTSIETSTPRKYMVESCNGLVCFGKGCKNTAGAVPFLICNPLTGECVFLPENNYSKLPRGISHRWNQPFEPYGILAAGFGYCPSTNRYKVVTIYYHSGDHKGHVQVYTVGDGWRYVEYIDRSKRYTFGNCSSIYANGALHWLHKSDCTRVEKCEIVAFDLEDEKFRSISLPREFEHYDRLGSLKLLGGNNNLYLVHNNSSCIDIWVYKRKDINAGTNHATKQFSRKLNYHGESCSSWNKEFSIPCKNPAGFTPFAITRNNEVLLWYQPSTPFETKLYCYNLVTSSLNNLWADETTKAMECWYTKAIPHRQSVVSLKDLGETNVTSLKDLEKRMLQVNSNGFCLKAVRENVTATIPTTETTKNNHEGEAKPAGSRGAKRSKKC